MKRIAVSITESEKEVSPSMDLCEYYFLVDYKDSEVKSICKVRNPYKSESNPEQVAEFISAQKTDTVITGKLLSNTQEVLTKNDIKVYANNFGEVNNVISNYISNN